MVADAAGTITKRDKSVILGLLGIASGRYVNNGAAPENTVVSLRAGVAAGADAIEFDVGLSRDGRAVVLHDTTLDRTTGQATDVVGNVYDVGIVGNTEDLDRNYTALQTQLYDGSYIRMDVPWWSEAELSPANMAQRGIR